MPASFDERSARRIAQVVRDRERDPRKRPQRAATPSVVLPTRNAMTTSTITARSGSTKGTGTVTLYVDDATGTGNDVVLQAGVTVWNPYTASIASGTWVVVAIVDGLPQIQGASCP